MYIGGYTIFFGMFGFFHFGAGVATVERNSGVILSIFDT